MAIYETGASGLRLVAVVTLSPLLNDPFAGARTLP